MLWGKTGGGTTNPDLIAKQITDQSDNGSLPALDYTPLLNAPPSTFNIIAQWPSDRTADHVDYFEIAFNDDVDLASFAFDKVALTGPSGRCSVNHIESRGYSVYRIYLSELLAEGTYSFEIASSIKDTDGRALNQDGDSNFGEAVDDIYRGRFVIDHTGPRIVTYSPQGDVAGTASYLDLYFSEKMRLSSMQSKYINVLGPQGTVSVTGIQDIGNNVYRVYFEPMTTYGQYQVVTKVPVFEDVAGNYLDQNRNQVQAEEPNDIFTATFNLVEIDLQISNIVVEPEELWVDDLVQVSWDGANQSGAPLIGSWSDAVYLSTDAAWDIDDPLLVMTSHTGGLGLAESYHEEVEVSIPGLLPGSYYVIVRADLFNEEKEGDEEGNNAIAWGPLALNVHELQADMAPSANSLTDDRDDYFMVEAQADSNLLILLDHITEGSSADLYASYESIPSPQQYDYASKDNIGTQVGIPAAQSGHYYVLVHSVSAQSPDYYEISAWQPDIVVTNIYPTHHSVSSPCVMTINGGGFDETVQIQFNDPENNVQQPDRIEVLSSDSLLAYLETPLWSQKSYDLIVSKAVATKSSGDGTIYSDKPVAYEYVQKDIFEVTDGVPYLETHVVMPAQMGYHWPQTVYIEYENTGQASMPSPLLKLDMTDKALLTLDKTVQESWWTMGNWWYGGPPKGVSDSVQFLTKGSGSTPYILQPGDKGRVPVYFMGCQQPWNFSDRVIEAHLKVCSESNTDSVDWSQHKEAMRPQWWIGSDAWDAVWQNYMTLAGDTWGEYIRIVNQMRFPQALAHIASGLRIWYTGEPGQATNIAADVIDVTTPLALAFRQADGLNPIYNLARATDMTVPAPGISLSFSRIYQQPISRRYQVGSLGRGWRHNWQMHLATNNEGDIAIYDITGTPRIFDKEGSIFKASKGDHGILTYSNGIYYVTELNGTITTYLSNGLFSTIEDTNGNRVTATYNGTDLARLTHTNGRQIIFTNNGGRITSITDTRDTDPDDDYTVQFIYDTSGQYLITVIEPGGQITNYSYEMSGTIQQRHALTGIEYPDLTHQYFSYSENGWLTSVSKDNHAEPLLFTYDNKGSVAVTDAQGRKTNYTFDWTGQISQVRDGNGNKLNLIYDNEGKIVGVVGPEGQQFAYAYDSKDNITSMEDGLKKTIKVAYEGNHNQLSRIIDPRNNDMKYQYDSRGNLTKIIYADNSSEDYTYDSNGNVLSWTNRRGQTVSYTYNSSGQVTSKDYDTTPELDFIYTYDTAGNLTSASDSHGMTIMSYDPVTNWLIRIEYPGGKSLDFQYDSVGRRTRRTDQDGYYVDYRYTPLGKLEQISDPDGITIVDYDYDATGQLVKKTLGNNTYTTYSYDSAGNLISLINYKPDGSIISSFAYSYNASGLRTSETTLAGTRTYEYDSNGQLVKVTYLDGNITEYLYDSVGNRIRVVEDGISTNYVTNNLNQYEQVGDTVYTYDTDGNMTTKTEDGVTTTYVYNAENRLIEVSTPTEIWIYTYDALGNRIATDNNGVVTNFLIDPAGYGNLIAEYDSSGDMVAKYEHGFGLLSKTEQSGDSYWYHFNAIGSTSEITTEDAAISNTYNYSPFGLILSETEIVSNPFKYVGESGIEQTNAGLYYMRKRLYDSLIGRFISMDPVKITAGDINYYRYVRNNPIKMIDPLGLIENDDEIDPRTRRILERLNNLTLADFQKACWESLGDATVLTILLTKGTLDLVSPIRWWKIGSMAVSFFLAEDIEDVVVSLIPFNEFYYYLSYLGLFNINVPDPNGYDGGDGSGSISHMVDPNRKLGPSGYGNSSYIPRNQLMAYTIEFENMDDATAPAHIIRVIDTLDAGLDLTTFELVELVFANQTISIPPGLKEYKINYVLPVDNEYVSASEIVVQINIRLDTAARELTLQMVGVDPETGWLPDNILLGVLYPNDESHRGDGHLSYNVKLKNNLSSGTVITNMASIYFDWNDPIDTPLVLHTLDNDLPESVIDGVTRINKTDIQVDWSGSDNSSGIADYDVYVSIDDNPFELWLQHDPNSTAVYHGQIGQKYSFYSIAYDNVGNREDAPGEPDIIAGLSFYSDLNLDGVVNVLDLSCLIEQWLNPPAVPSADMAPDDGDGFVGFDDFAILAREWLEGH